MNMKWFWFKQWMMRIRVIEIKWLRFYVMFAFVGRDGFDNIEINLGIKLKIDKFYQYSKYHPWERYKRKPWSVRIDLFSPWIQFGYHGKRTDDGDVKYDS